VILSLLRTLFSDEAYDTVFCADGRSALQAMEEGVDVLLTDKNLPDVGGLELVRRASELQPDVQCLILTGYPSLDTALEALGLMVFDYIVKPPEDIFEIKRKVAKAFEKQAMSRENQRLMRHLTQKNTELEETLAELRDVQQELIQSEKLAGIGTLAAGSAHEISSPLFGVMGLAEAILDEDDLTLVRQYATDIVDYSRSIKDIVVDLTGYSRTAEAEFLTTVDLKQVVDDALRLVQRSISCAEVTLLNEVPADLYVQARTNEIQQVFVNLVKNAVEALLEIPVVKHPQVRITAGLDPGHVWAEVADNGAGIPADQQAMVFDPFFTTKAPGKGTGLGLNIVYRILTKYRGSVSLESREGEGATFHLRLPTFS